MSTDYLHDFLIKSFMSLAKVCLKRGIRIQEALEDLKHGFVKAAVEQLSENKEEISLSKLSAMTGLQRKDISRILDGLKPADEFISLTTRVVGAWTNSKQFSLKGNPKPLTFKGKNNDFELLVLSVSKDLNFSTVLNELERLHMIKKEEGLVHLLYNALKLDSKEEQSLNLLAKDVSDLVKAVEQNVDHESKIPNLHITTRYDNVCLSKVEEVRTWLLKEGAKLHAKVREFVSERDKDLNPALFKEEGGGRVVFSSFSLTEIKGKPENEDV